VKFAFIAEEKADFPTAVLCRTLQVSRSGFYASRARPESKRVQDDRRYAAKVREFHTRSRRIYGAPRIFDDFKEAKIAIGKKRVARIMRAEGLSGKVRRRYRATTMSDHDQPVAANVLAREFRPAAPNLVWAGDTTELVAGSGKIYLAVILDLYSRFVVGWALSAVNDTSLVLRALEAALKRRAPPAGLLHHSDQGSPYASDAYQRVLLGSRITTSMSRRGNCYDNAVIESFFSTLKLELGECFLSHHEAKQLLFDYIEVFYNQQRKHSSIGYHTPAGHEKLVELLKTAA
jgi:transposase InsO family protein